MQFLPVQIKAQDRRCLVVGCGKIGTRRIKRFAQASGTIDIISIAATAQARQLAEASGGRVQLRPWNDCDLDADYQFIVAATDDRGLNAHIATLCHRAGILCNCASDSRLSSIVFPGFIDRDPITISVSGGTASPVLSAELVRRIDTVIPAGYGRLAGLVAKYRQRVNEKISDPHARRRFWDRVLKGSIAESIFSGNRELSEQQLCAEIESYRPDETLKTGEVYLLGAGPGDPDLLTFRAHRLLQQSDIILYDRLVSARILALANDSAEKIYVGKKRSVHSIPQPGINQLLVEQAQKGKRVARLKGGDPFIFGRGGEEIELLTENRVPFQVVPGITAASGCASYSGIPLTHREHAQSVRFVTGQLKDGSVNLPWPELVADDQTVVVYMGLAGLPIIAKALIDHGMDTDTPAAMVEQGTTLDQRVHVGTIATLPDIVEKAGARAPTLLIIGSVVSLHHKLCWFQKGT